MTAALHKGVLLMSFGYKCPGRVESRLLFSDSELSGESKIATVYFNPKYFVC